MPTNLEKTTTQALKWSFVAKLFDQGLRFVVVAVLARLILPQDFGLIAMAMVFINFLVSFSDLGFSTALVQKKRVTKFDSSSVFWMNLLMSIIFYAIAVFLSLIHI